MPSAASLPFPPTAARIDDSRLVSLELQDGAVYQGYSFGAEKSTGDSVRVLATVTNQKLQVLLANSSSRLAWWGIPSL